jgi:hypothetical protein
MDFGTAKSREGNFKEVIAGLYSAFKKGLLRKQDSTLHHMISAATTGCHGQTNSDHLRFLDEFALSSEESAYISLSLVVP